MLSHVLSIPTSIQPTILTPFLNGSRSTAELLKAPSLHMDTHSVLMILVDSQPLKASAAIESIPSRSMTSPAFLQKVFNKTVPSFSSTNISPP